MKPKKKPAKPNRNGINTGWPIYALGYFIECIGGTASNRRFCRGPVQPLVVQ